MCALSMIGEGCENVFGILCVFVRTVKMCVMVCFVLFPF